MSATYGCNTRPSSCTARTAEQPASDAQSMATTTAQRTGPLLFQAHRFARDDLLAHIVIAPWLALPVRATEFGLGSYVSRAGIPAPHRYANPLAEPAAGVAAAGMVGEGVDVAHSLNCAAGWTARGDTRA